MGFYEEISKYYDYIFPAGQQQLDIVQDVFDKNAGVLDVACGTGTYTLAMAQIGYNVTGIDISRDMIDIARANATSKGLNAAFHVMDMTDLSVFQPASFDGVMCMGNSLVHLSNEAMVSIALKEFHRVLKAPGKLLLQIMNYDRIIKYNIKELPTIRNDDIGLAFTRRYSLEPEGYIEFITELTVDSQRFENSVKLLPLQSQKLVSILSDAGFADISLYGDFDKRPFDSDNSMLLVIETAKDRGGAYYKRLRSDI
jgi:ubiquinone/menaquinone biosynthesis C-methylase UbiE